MGSGQVRFAKTAVGGFHGSIARDASRAQNQRFGPSRVIQRDPYWTGEPTMGSFAVRIVGAYRTRSVLTASRCATRREGGSRVAGSRITVSRLGGRSAIRAERESGFSPKVGSRRYLVEGFRAEGRR